MATKLKKEDLEEKTDATSAEAQAEETSETETAEQDRLKAELEKVQQKTKYTEKEKAEHKLRENAKRAKELGLDPAEVLGLSNTDVSASDEDDDKPITVGMFKKLQRESASKNAIQLADDIENETERELTKWHLQNSIKSTGNPSDDLKLARTLTNAAKNSQILEEVQRKTDAKTHSNASSANAKEVKIEGELTPAEIMAMKGFKLTKEEVIKARKG